MPGPAAPRVGQGLGRQPGEIGRPGQRGV